MRLPAPGRPHADRRRPDLPPTYINRLPTGGTARASTAAREQQRRVRTFTDGKLVPQDGRLPAGHQTGTAITGFSENWWIGLGMLHTLFTLEHNAICDPLKQAHPQLDRRRSSSARPG